MTHWITESVGLGQALDPNSTNDPAKVLSHTQQWGVPTPMVAPQFNGTFWFWQLAPQSEWVPKLGAASSLRDAQALATWNASKSDILSGPYVRNPPYVFQSGLAAPGPVPTPTPQPTPAPTPQPPPQKPATSSSSDFWKPTLTVGAILAGVALLAWYAT